MMNRLTGFLLCAVPALLMLVCGLVVPAHLRAVDASVLERGGQEYHGFGPAGAGVGEAGQPGSGPVAPAGGARAGMPDRQGLGLAIT